MSVVTTMMILPLWGRWPRGPEGVLYDIGREGPPQSLRDSSPKGGASFA
jgi:hypothetical protein